MKSSLSSKKSKRNPMQLTSPRISLLIELHCLERKVYRFLVLTRSQDFAFTSRSSLIADQSKISSPSAWRAAKVSAAGVDWKGLQDLYEAQDSNWNTLSFVKCAYTTPIINHSWLLSPLWLASGKENILKPASELGYKWWLIILFRLSSFEAIIWETKDFTRQLVSCCWR